MDDRENAQTGDSEAGRIAAEKGRVAAEKERVVAEGSGPVEAARRQQEQGREDAEEERVTAEQVREEARKAANKSLDKRFVNFQRRQFALYALFFAMLAFVVWHSAEQREKLAEQSTESRAQVCELFYDQYEALRVREERTKEYLDALSPQEKQTGINKAVVKQLPEIAKDVEAHKPPEFCGPPIQPIDADKE